MAAADLSRSRGVDRSTKGLFFISTLLCLICFSSSLLDKDQLEESKEKYQKIKQEVDELKAKYKTDLVLTSEILSEYITLMDSWIGLARKTEKLLPDSSSVDKYINLKAYMEKNKAQIDKRNKALAEKIENTEKKMIILEKLIQLYEHQQAEL